jgi:hypothetical protein
MRIETGAGDLMQKTSDGQAHVRYSVDGRSRDRVALCVMCIVHKETRSAGFLVQPQIKVDSFFRFSLKTGGYGSCGLASK